MNQNIKNAIKSYVLLLPDLYSSPNDHPRLVKIAYEIEISDAYFDVEFKEFFIDELTKKFNLYSEAFIEKFYNDRKKEIEDYAFVIGCLKSMELLK